MPICSSPDQSSAVVRECLVTRAWQLPIQSSWFEVLASLASWPSGQKPFRPTTASPQDEHEGSRHQARTRALRDLPAAQAGSASHGQRMDEPRRASRERILEGFSGRSAPTDVHAWECRESNGDHSETDQNLAATSPQRRIDASLMTIDTTPKPVKTITR